MNINISGSVNTMDFFSNILEKFDKTMHVFNAFGCKLEHIEKNTTSRVLQIVKCDSGENLFTALLDLKADSASLHIGLPLNYDIKTAVNMHQILIKLNNSIAVDDSDYKQSKIEIIEFPKITILINQEIIYDMEVNSDIFVNNIFDSLFSMIQLVLSLKATITVNIEKNNEQHHTEESDLSKHVKYTIENSSYMLDQLEKERRKNKKELFWLAVGVIGFILLFIVMYATEGFGASDWTTY